MIETIPILTEAGPHVLLRLVLPQAYAGYFISYPQDQDRRPIFHIEYLYLLKTC